MTAAEGVASLLPDRYGLVWTLLLVELANDDEVGALPSHARERAIGQADTSRTRDVDGWRQG
jgi:hypothetical protein